MKKILLISLLLLSLSSCWTDNNSTSLTNDSKNKWEQVIIDNFFEKPENDIYKSILSSKIINWLSIYEKEVYFKKDNETWYWSFDKQNWMSVFNQTMKCENNCESNWLTPTWNNLKIINELEKYSKQNNSISERKYKYLQEDHWSFAIKDLWDWKYDFLCYWASCKQEDKIKEIVENEWINFWDVNITRWNNDSIDIYFQNILNSASDKSKMNNFINILKSNGYIKKDWDNQFREFYIYQISEKQSEIYSKEIEEIKAINNDYAFIEFEITNQVFINKDIDKKSVFDFLDDWLICDDNMVAVSWFANISCVVVDDNVFNNSMDILNKYFYAETDNNWTKKYYYNNSANYLSVSDIKDNKITVNLYINTNYSSEENFIKDKIDLVNHKDEIAKKFLENIKQDETKVDFDNNLTKTENFLITKNDLKFDRFYKNIKVYDINSDYLETLYFNEKSEPYSLALKIKNLQNISINWSDYELYLVYSESTGNTPGYKSLFDGYNYGYILFNKSTKKVYLMKN